MQSSPHTHTHTVHTHTHTHIKIVDKIKIGDTQSRSLLCKIGVRLDEAVRNLEIFFCLE